MSGISKRERAKRALRKEDGYQGMFDALRGNGGPVASTADPEWFAGWVLAFRDAGYDIKPFVHTCHNDCDEYLRGYRNGYDAGWDHGQGGNLGASV